MMPKQLLTSCLVLVALFSMGCDRNKPASVEVAEPVTTALASASSAEPAIAASSAPAPQPKPDPASAKQWSGTYESAPAKMETPEKVRDFTWNDDDGSTAVGKGQLTMTIDDGVVAGEATGPLGPQKLAGIVEEDLLRIELIPRDPTSSAAMAGSGTAQLNEGSYSGSLRCSGPKGAIVREVTLTLQPGT
jgi:hypothetical protein